MRDPISTSLTQPSSRLRRYAWLLALPLLLAGLLAITAMRPVPVSSLQQIRDKGELVVVTRADPVAFYQDQHGDTGFDYELARRFATSLGVKLKVIQADSLNEVYSLLVRGQADLAAAALNASSQHGKLVSYSHGYLLTGSRIVYRQGDDRPKSVNDLAGHTVAVLAGSNDSAYLSRLASRGLNIHVDNIDAADSARLLASVSQGQADYALINTNAFALQHPLFPELASAFPIDGSQQFAWAISKNADPALQAAVNHFLDDAGKNGTIKTLAAQFYGKHNSFNLYASQVFMRHLSERLPRYASTFFKAGSQNQIDWRLLAAMGYQESHWDAGAQSPTGVRGLMMLTQTTANALGVNRDNPAQSIRGGARYLRTLMDNLPERIQQPDRTWMAIAAYNIGSAHLEDARVLTQSQGGNPDSWSDVRKRLPLLGQPGYGKYLRYGMADGNQAVRYVNNIHHYYNLLVWAENSLQDNDTLLAMAN